MAEESRRQRAAARAQESFLKKQIELEEKGVKIGKDIGDNLEMRINLLNESGDVTEEILKKSEDLEKQFVSFTNKIPIVGDLLEKQLKEKIEETGGLQQIVYNKLIQSADGAKSFSQVLRNLVIRNPITALIASVVALFAIIRKVRMAARDLAEDLNVSTKQARDLLIPLKIQETKFKVIGLDAEKIKTTLGEIVNEFGSLENVTAKNAANVSKLAQNTGVSGKEIVQFNKVMMDLTGSSFDVATNIAQTAVNMAKSANVATGKVLSDMASNAETFAKFSMDGAKGLAEAAIEAAKIGGSLETILKAADSVLQFETSLTNQFKAQVLTGKQLNLEKARQLSLEGDIAGFTAEIQSVIGGLGDLQALNVVQRQAVADAIGISVRELQRIAAGEQAQERETVQDKLDVSNGFLREIAGYTSETAAKDNSVEVIQPVF
tara:strand:- start:5132 stop:6436 length:1305 start_codon:yes stop_codon:yes gene_type:complete